MKPSAQCVFSTKRLSVGPWKQQAATGSHDLASVVASILDGTTTAALPDEWQGDYDIDRARSWIQARDAESPTLLVVDIATAEPVALLMLFETDGDSGTELRIGYVIAQGFWRRGFATELVDGVVGWARAQTDLASLAGGVADGNDASARVLLRNGFEAAEWVGSETIYRLTL